MNLLAQEKLYRMRVLFGAAIVALPSACVVTWANKDWVSLANGVFLAAIWTVHGLLVRKVSDRVNRALSILSGAAMAATVAVMSNRTGGSTGMVFSILWVMPFSFVLIFPRDLVSSGAAGIAAMAAGTAQMIEEGRNPIDILQWLGLMLCFWAFALVCASMLQRTLSSQLKEISDEFAARTQAERAQHELQTRLAISDRLASVGTLAAGVAHELNNPLAYIAANLDFALDTIPALKPQDSAEVMEALKDARQGAERMRIIIRDLKTFSRRDEEKTGPVELSSVLESCLGMGWNELRHRAQVKKDFEPELWAQGSEARLAQVFLNLVVNAAQAIPAGAAQKNVVKVSTRSTDSQVIVEVTDTGEGIPAENLRRIFDPFFTTKPVGVGTGLGLSICHNIVRDHGGAIAVESTVGKGTTFRVTLPRAEAVEQSGAFAIPHHPEQRRRILLIDDEESVGNALKRQLSARHDVTVVTSGQQALTLLHADVPDYLLCDLMMPEMTGMQLFHRVSEQSPSMARRIIFMSGGVFTPEARSFVAETRQPVLDKPLDIELLRKAMKKVNEREVQRMKHAA